MSGVTHPKPALAFLGKIRIPWWIAIVTGILLFIIWLQAISLYKTSLIAEYRSQTSNEVGLLGNTLSLEVNRRVSLLTGLSAFAQTDSGNPGFEGRFTRFAQKIYLSTPGIRMVALAPANKLEYVFPLTGNSAAVGYEPLKDQRPIVREDMERMAVLKQLVISGPVDLIQGGKGLIARQPIYEGDKYWGFAEISINLDTSFDWSVFDVENHTLAFVLLDTRGKLISGDLEILNQQPVIQAVDLLDGTWKLAGIPKGGWQAVIAQPLDIFQAIGLLLVGLVTLSVYLISDQQWRMARAVKERTRELTAVNSRLRDGIRERLLINEALRSSEEQLSNILRVAPDAIVTCSKSGSVLLFNHAAEDILGYPADEVLGKSITEIFPDKVTQWIGDRDQSEIHKDHLVSINNVPFIGQHRD
ncbi:MAG TPA: PAS domain S-box protein, partial [Anaerolineales bacterium]|nr:PAS domain S-box protein [Anaerolineales bacterium]